MKTEQAAGRLLATDRDAATAVARVTLGTVMLAHGLQKAFGWFGGYGFEGTMAFFTNTIGLPAVAGFLIILLESAGALALIAGLAGRPIALGLVVVMAGAAWTVHRPNGFFMNWFADQKGEGIEFAVLAIALSIVVVLRGSGAWSVDRALAARLA